MDIRLYFKIAILKWPKVLKEIDHGCFIVFGPYFIGKSPSTLFMLTFQFWSIIVCPTQNRSRVDEQSIVRHNFCDCRNDALQLLGNISGNVRHNFWNLGFFLG